MLATTTTGVVNVIAPPPATKTTGKVNVAAAAAARTTRGVVNVVVATTGASGRTEKSVPMLRVMGGQPGDSNTRSLNRVG